jgi:hypothetical protein
MADELDVRVERIRTLGLLGVAVVGALGGWIANSATSSEKGPNSETVGKTSVAYGDMKTTLTYFSAPDGMTKNQCVDKIAARLALGKFIYTSKAGTQGRKILLNWEGANAFVYCIPRPTTDQLLTIVAGANYIPETTQSDTNAPRWEEFIHVIEGAIAQN